MQSEIIKIKNIYIPESEIMCFIKKLEWRHLSHIFDITFVSHQEVYHNINLSRIKILAYLRKAGFLLHVVGCGDYTRYPTHHKLI